MSPVFCLLSWRLMGAEVYMNHHWNRKLWIVLMVKIIYVERLWLFKGDMWSKLNCISMMGDSSGLRLNNAIKLPPLLKVVIQQTLQEHIWEHSYTMCVQSFWWWSKAVLCSSIPLISMDGISCQSNSFLPSYATGNQPRYYCVATFAWTCSVCKVCFWQVELVCMLFVV